MRVRTELCCPCGECDWCRANWKARDDARRLRPRVRALERALALMAGELALDLSAYDGAQRAASPPLRRQVRVLARARRLLRPRAGAPR